jgi:hypothetical protein
MVEAEAPLASRALVWCTALASLAPLLFNLSRFQMLFFFGDEWDLLSQMSHVGLLRSSLEQFGENFVPLFRLLWEGAVLAFHGSYFSVVVLLWLTHFAIMVTFGSILRRIGLHPFVIVFSMLTCSLAWSNIESLAWTVQWSPMLATLFFVLSFLLLTSLGGVEEWTWQVILKLALYIVLLLASALCFSRGVINGPALAGFALLGWRPTTNPLLRRTILEISLIVPAILMAFIYVPMMLRAPHPQSASHLQDIVLYGVYAFSLNPLFRIACWDQGQVGAPAAVVFGLLQGAIVLSGFAVIRKSRLQMAFMGSLLVYELLSCSLLAIGRYNTGMQSTVSSRYQYIALLGLAPFIGILLQRILFKPSNWLDRAAMWAVLLAWCVLLLYRWPIEINTWSIWRGTEVRKALQLSQPQDGPFAASTQPWGSAAELQVKYNLH